VTVTVTKAVHLPHTHALQGMHGYEAPPKGDTSDGGTLSTRVGDLFLGRNEVGQIEDSDLITAMRL